MAKRRPLIFSEEDRLELQRDRYAHPHPHVQRRMEVLGLIAQGGGYGQAARLAGVSPATGDRFVSMYRRVGVEALRQLNWRKPISALETHHQTLEESFGAQPPHTVNEARARIRELTGLDRGPTQVRRFLKKLSA